MGGCFSKKKEEEKDDPSSSPRARGGGRQGQKTAAASSRDPPPTESPQEEKVKEVLSETPKITRQKSNKYSDRGNRDATADRSQVREEFSAASTTLTEATATTITAAAAEDDEEGEIEMKKMRPAVTRSRSSANFQKKIYNRSDFNVKDAHRPAAAGKREIRGVDVGCRSARSSPSPAMEEGNAVTRNRVSSAAAAAAAAAGGGGHNNKNSNHHKRSSDRGERWLSPATKGSVVPAMNQRRQCRANPNLSARASTTTTTRANINGRFSPQKVRPPPPARVLHFEEARRGQDGNNAGSAAAAAAEDGNALEAKEESLENPLVSMECFIFL